MNSLRHSRLIPALLILGMLCLLTPLPVVAQEAQAQIKDVDTSLQEARKLIKGGDYDRAIEILKGTIGRARSRLSDLREAYLLLIKTYVILGNDLKFKPQGREASNLNYKAARELIAECLHIKELRHTRPEPASEYPSEMVRDFAEVRSQIFGSFRVAGLDPPDASVIFYADTLRAMDQSGALGDVDLTAGLHLVVVRAKGYKGATDEITISPGATLQESYKLSKRRGRMWYATVGTGALGVVGGVVALIAGKGSKPAASAPEPLPGPPGPPSR